MGWWRRLFGEPRRPETPPAVTFPGGARGRSRREAFDLGHSGPAFEVNLNVLFQPEEVLRERVASAEAFAEYLKQVMDTAAAYWAGVPPGEGRAVALVLAVKPGGRSRFWLEASPPGLDEGLVRGLLGRLQRLPAPAVRGGPVALALRATLWGCGGTPGGWPHLPREWQEACAGRELLVPDGVLAVVWPD
jgi:hypothetical protein